MYIVGHNYSWARSALLFGQRYVFIAALVLARAPFAGQNASAQVWSVKLPSLAVDLRGLDVDGLGNVYATGRAAWPRVDSSSGYLARVDEYGHMVWIRQVAADAFLAQRFWIGIGMAVVTGGQGPVGFAGVDFTFDAGMYSSGGVSLASYDPDGGPSWSRTIGFPNAPYYFLFPGYIQGIDVDAEGNIYVAGVFADTLFAGPHVITPTLPPWIGWFVSVFVAKYTSAGEIAWARVVGERGHLGTWELPPMAAFDVDANGNMYLQGYFLAGAEFAVAGTDTVTLGKDTHVLVSLDGTGDIRWALPVFEGSTHSEKMFLQVSERQNAVGVVRHLVTSLGSNVTLTWFSLDGMLLSTQSLFRGDSVKLKDFTIDSQASKYVTGTFKGTRLWTDDFELSAPENYREGYFNNSRDGFVAEYDLAGNFVRVVHVTGVDNQEITSIAVNASDELLVGGYFDRIAILGMDTLNAEGYSGAFIANYGSSGLVDRVTEQVDAAYSEAVILHPNYPNPFGDGTDIGFRLPSPAEVRIRVYDITGRMVDELGGRRFSGGEHLVRIEAAALSSGLYYYRLTALGQTRVGSMLLVR